jgi:PAS domain S-box-containing protein
MGNLEKLNRRYLLVGQILSGVLILLGVLVLFGWQFDIVALKSIVPGVVNMNPLTATTFILIGGGLLYYSETNSKFSRTFLVIVAIWALLTGVLTYLRILFHIDLHHDQIIFHQKILSTTSFSNNRVAPNTALNFILMSIVLVFFVFKKGFKFLQFLSFVTFLIAILAILGYAYSVKDLYGFLAYTPMALNTALGFLICSIAIFFLTTQEGFMRVVFAETIGGVTARRLIPAVIFIPGILGWLRLLGQQKGYYNTQYGISILVVSIMAVFFSLVYWTTLELDAIDSSRRKAQERLNESQENIQRANEALDGQLKVQEEQNKQLEQAKKASLNILEDLQDSKIILEAAKAQDEAILSGIGDAVFAVDPEGQIILFNPVAEAMSGFNQKESLGKHYSKILNFKFEDNDLENFAFIETALGGKKASMANHTVIVHKSGKKVVVADSAAPIFGEKKKVIGVVVVFRDVTQERAVDRAKTEFVSLASHQLRTPLTAIKWYSEMLLDGDAGKLNKVQREYIQDINIGNQRMVDLVNSLLNVSRIDLGSFAVNPKPTDVAVVVETVLKDLVNKINDKGLIIKKQFDSKLGLINLDQQLINIVIQNLLTNAVKYTPEKGKISVELSRKPKSLFMQVTDNGYGIPKAQQGKIFNKLFRADNAVEKEPDGNGLGLYIVKAIVEQAGGKISFDSEEGKGTSFYIEMPLTGMEQKTGAKALG